MNLINHFNYMSRAVASMIAQEPKVRHRAKIYEKFIILAEVCFILFVSFLIVILFLYFIFYSI